MPVAKIDFKIPRPDFSKLIELMPKGPKGNIRLFFENALSQNKNGYLDESDRSRHWMTVRGFIDGVFSTDLLTTEQYCELCKEASKVFTSHKEMH